MTFIQQKKQSGSQDSKEKNIKEIMEDKNFLPSFFSDNSINVHKIGEFIDSQISENIKDPQIYQKINLDYLKQNNLIDTESLSLEQQIKARTYIGEEIFRIKKQLPQLLLAQLVWAIVEVSLKNDEQALKKTNDAFDTFQKLSNEIEKYDPNSFAISLMIKMEHSLYYFYSRYSQDEKCQLIRSSILEKIQELDEESRREFEEIELSFSADEARKQFEQKNHQKAIQLLLRSNHLTQKIRAQNDQSQNDILNNNQLLLTMFLQETNPNSIAIKVATDVENQVERVQKDYQKSYLHAAQFSEILSVLIYFKYHMIGKLDVSILRYKSSDLIGKFNLAVEEIEKHKDGSPDVLQLMKIKQQQFQNLKQFFEPYNI